MNREFYADRPNEKWLTDVTAFKYYDGPVIKKLYLSAYIAIGIKLLLYLLSFLVYLFCRQVYLQI